MPAKTCMGGRAVGRMHHRTGRSCPEPSPSTALGTLAWKGWLSPVSTVPGCSAALAHGSSLVEGSGALAFFVHQGQAQAHAHPHVPHQSDSDSHELFVFVFALLPGSASGARLVGPLMFTWPPFRIWSSFTLFLPDAWPLSRSHKLSSR